MTVEKKSKSPDVERQEGNQDKIVMALALVVLVVIATIVLYFIIPSQGTELGDLVIGSTIKFDNIAAKMQEASDSIDTYKVDFNLKMEMSSEGDSAALDETVTTSGSASIDKKNKRAHISLSMQMPAPVGYEEGPQRTEVYIVDDTMYMLFEDPSTGLEEWAKQSAQEEIWSEQLGIDQALIDLLKEVEGKIVAIEMIDSRETYVAEVTPDIKKILSYILSTQGINSLSYMQQQIDEAIEELENSIKELSIKLWVGKSDSLVYKVDAYAEISLDYSVVYDVPDMGVLDMAVSLEATIDYNVPVDFKLPDGASGATPLDELYNLTDG
jgi:hypothetical protein